MIKKYVSAAVVAVLIAQSCPAWADWDRGRHEEHRWGHGYVVRRVPPGYRTVMFAGLAYLFCEGLFYRHTPAGYVIVEPPIGAVVPTLPPTYTTVVIQQTPYYCYNGTYYATAPGGYSVVPPPPAVVPQTPVQTQAVSPATKVEYKDTIDTYDIYIPNANGSFTLVTLKKAEKGFVGPQGEFYPEHPTVEQLKALYGKNK